MFGGTASTVGTVRLGSNKLEVLYEGTFHTASITHLYLDNNLFVLFPGAALGTVTTLQTL